MSAARKGLESDGPGADSPAMEARVLALEGLARQTLEGLARLEAGQRKMELDMAELKGRVSQLPTVIQLLGFILAVLAISGLVRVFAP